MEDGYYYTGEYMDTETGLYYLRARYMNPATATFTSMDSYAGNIYDPASLHRYLYANANPVKYTDPSGHSPLASLTTAVSQLTVLQTNAIILSMATVSGLMNMAMKTLMCIVDGKGLPSASEYGKAFIEGFYIGAILGMFSMFAAVCMNLTLLEMYLCIGGGTAAKLAIDGAIAAYKGDVKGAVINGLFALFSMAAFSKMYDVYTETTISSGPGNATKVECKPDGTCEQKNNVPSEEVDTVTVSKSGGETASGNAGGSYSPKNKTKLWGQEKYVTEKGLNTVKQHLSGKMEADFNNAMIERLENAYKNNAKISGADLDFYSHEIYESMMMKNGMSYEAAHEAAKAYYNAVEFNLYHPDVIMQYKREFNSAWFRFWGVEEN